MLSNEYFLTEIRFDTAENEPAKHFAKFASFANPSPEVTPLEDMLPTDAVATSLRGRWGWFIPEASVAAFVVTYAAKRLNRKLHVKPY